MVWFHKGNPFGMYPMYDYVNTTKEAKDNKGSFPRYIYIYYITSDETTYTSSLMIDWPTFISSIGGNLGLFLGFSFLGILFPMYEKIEQGISDIILTKRINEVRVQEEKLEK